MDFLEEMSLPVVDTFVKIQICIKISGSAIGLRELNPRWNFANVFDDRPHLWLGTYLGFLPRQCQQDGARGISHVGEHVCRQLTGIPTK